MVRNTFINVQQVIVKFPLFPLRISPLRSEMATGINSMNPGFFEFFMSCVMLNIMYKIYILEVHIGHIKKKSLYIFTKNNHNIILYICYYGL